MKARRALQARRRRKTDSRDAETNRIIAPPCAREKADAVSTASWRFTPPFQKGRKAKVDCLSILEIDMQRLDTCLVPLVCNLVYLTLMAYDSTPKSSDAT